MARRITSSLQRRDVTLVFVLARGSVLQRVGWIDVHPHRRGIALPHLYRELFGGMRDWLGIVARLAHRDQEVRNALA
jgi:hypothetical protein